jgi:hypothetical protein
VHVARFVALERLVRLFGGGGCERVHMAHTVPAQTPIQARA